MGVLTGGPCQPEGALLLCARGSNGRARGSTTLATGGFFPLHSAITVPAEVAIALFDEKASASNVPMILDLYHRLADSR